MKKERFLNYVAQTKVTDLSKMEIILKVNRVTLNTIRYALQYLIEDSKNCDTIRTACYLLEDIEEILQISIDNNDKDE